MEKEITYPALLSFGYDGGKLWVANFVGLRGCWVEGPDRADVVSRAPAALGEYLRGCLEAGIPIPDASSADELRELGMGEVITVRARFDAEGNDA